MSDSFKFKKKFGQNFLVDNNVIDKIVSSANIDRDTLVIEIGPGAGAISKKIALCAKNLLCYEIDNSLKDTLDEIFLNTSNVVIKYEDFLCANVLDDIENYTYNKKYIVANLPYYITTPIIGKIIDDEIPAREIVIMIQKEVADRLCADVGTKEYGQLTVFLNYFYDIKRVINVSKNCFVPKPKVDSAVIKMTRKNELEKVLDRAYFSKVVKDSFRFKRKTIKNNLCNYDMDIISRVLNKYGFDVSTRSENIPYYVFVELSNELFKGQLFFCYIFYLLSYDFMGEYLCFRLVIW